MFPHLMRATELLSADERRALIALDAPCGCRGRPRPRRGRRARRAARADRAGDVRYPQLRSASIPALWAVQRHYGWCTPEGIRRGGGDGRDARLPRVRVASFYDLFHTEPVASHRVLVCHNISCCSTAATSFAGVRRGGRRRHLRTRVRVHGRLRHRPDGVDRRALLRPLDAADAAAAIEALRGGEQVLPGKAIIDRPAAGGPRASSPTPCVSGAERGASSGGSHARDPRPLPRYRCARTGDDRRLSRARRLRALERLLSRARPRGPDLRDRGVRAARPRRRRLLDGQERPIPARGEMEKYLCCNADESEPGAFKDRELMAKNPHQLIEGCAIAALAVGATHAFIFIRGEALGDRRHPRPRQCRGLSGGLSGIGHPRHGDPGRARRPPRRRRVHLRRGDGAARRARGQARQPALRKPPFPAPRLYDGPTLINNVETLNVPHIVNNGAAWLKGFGPSSRRHQGGLGLRLRPAARNYDARDPVARSPRPRRCRAGGRSAGEGLFPAAPRRRCSPRPSSTSCRPFEDLAGAGSMLGSGSIIVADDTVHPRPCARRALYHHESCGKCTPCREGTNWTAKMLERLARGEATLIDLEVIASVQENIIGHCLCVLGDSMAMCRLARWWPSSGPSSTSTSTTFRWPSASRPGAAGSRQQRRSPPDGRAAADHDRRRRGRGRGRRGRDARRCRQGR